MPVIPLGTVKVFYIAESINNLLTLIGNAIEIFYFRNDLNISNNSIECYSTFPRGMRSTNKLFREIEV